MFVTQLFSGIDQHQDKGHSGDKAITKLRANTGDDQLYQPASDQKQHYANQVVEKALMTFTRSNLRPDATPLLGELPEFVKHVPIANGSAFPAVHYWMPERTGDAELDYQRGGQHFKEAVAFSYRPNAQMFLAHVLVAMFQNLGPMESGFIDAMLKVAQVGSIPPKLTAAEVAAIGIAPEDEPKLRAAEGEMAKAIATKDWLPDFLCLTLLRVLSGAEGEFIGGAITMIARMALNGSRD